jgi:hypothetical protein
MCGAPERQSAFGARTFVLLSPQIMITKYSRWKPLKLTWAVYHVAEPFYATKQSGAYCVRNNEANVLFLFKEYLDRNITSIFRTQSIPAFFVAEHYMVGKTLPSGVGV